MSGYDDDKVGYKRPPKHTRFKAGNPSANPRGRPRRQSDDDIGSLLAKALETEITINEGNGPITVSAFQAIVRQMSNAALAGETVAMNLLGSLRKKIGTKANIGPTRMLITYVNANTVGRPSPPLIPRKRKK